MLYTHILILNYIIMKEIKVYQATTNSDLTEWRWHEVVIANFTQKKDAELVCVWKGVMESDWDVREKIIKVFDTIDEYQDLTWDFPKETLEKIKKKALSKLDPRERKVLWLA